MVLVGADYRPATSAERLLNSIEVVARPVRHSAMVPQNIVYAAAVVDFWLDVEDSITHEAVSFSDVTPPHEAPQTMEPASEFAREQCAVLAHKAAPVVLNARAFQAHRTHRASTMPPEAVRAAGTIRILGGGAAWNGDYFRKTGACTPSLTGTIAINRAAHLSYAGVRLEAPARVELAPHCLQDSRSAFELRSRLVVPSPVMVS